MRLYRVVMRSGVNMDVMAKAMVDDPAVSDVVYFFHDETMHHLAAFVKRAEIAGIILGPQKSSAFTQHL